MTPDWASWFSGLVDGEGCFLIYRTRGRSGYYHSAKLRIGMRADDRPMLEDIRRTLGFGTVRSYPSWGPRWRPVCIYQVCRATDMLALVRLFDRYPLRSKKRRDYEVWRTFVLLHASPKNATDPRLEELCREIKDVRRFEEPA